MTVADGVPLFPFAYDDTIPSLADQPIGMAGEEGDLVINLMRNALVAVERRVGKIGETDPNSHEFRLLAGDVTRVINVQNHGVLPANSGATNSYNFAVLEAATTGAADFYFPGGSYDTWGFGLSKSGHRIVGDGGSSYAMGKGTRFRLTTTGVCVTIAGTDAGGGYGTRLFGCGVEGVFLANASTLTNIGMKTKYVSHMTHRDIWWSGFRGDGGALSMHNTSDSRFHDCYFEYCGSTDGTNKAVIRMTGQADGAETSYWGVDQTTFDLCRFEVCGDRILKIENVSHGVAKIRFEGCKFEASGSDSNGINGSNDANQAQFWIDNGSWVVFHSCDFTLQNRQSAYVQPTMFRLKNNAFVTLNQCQFQFGSGAFPQVFTNMFVLDAAVQLLVLTDVWMNSGNSTAFPTNVISCTNSPRVTSHNCGFTPTQGGSKTLSDWITGATQSGGVVA